MDFDTFPLPDNVKGPPLMSVGDAAEMLGRTEHVAAPTKVNLLSHLPREPSWKGALDPIVRSLVREDQAPGEVDQAVGRLWERIEATRRGEDPIFGDSPNMIPFGNLLEVLVRELGVASVRVAPKCEATTSIIANRPALSVTTTIKSLAPLVDVDLMADPRNWPLCAPQSTFFKSMKMVVPAEPPPTKLRDPDEGWTATLREIVDFGFGIMPSRKTTDLDVVYFRRGDAAGCTYDLNRSFGDEILVDRGYVLVEDLDSVDIRRTTTLKQVYLRSRPPPGKVCRLWSMAHGMVTSSCMLSNRHDAWSSS